MADSNVAPGGPPAAPATQWASDPRHAELLKQFRRGARENPKFWARFGAPDLHGLSILDLGCGVGSLAIDMVLGGAANVMGLDLKNTRIEFARGYVAVHLPMIEDRVRFLRSDLKELSCEPFDAIVSKDVFEHVSDLAEVLAEMKRRLKPGGRIYAGFGPLYKSPWGDHDRRKVILKPWGVLGRTLAALPWGHLLFEPLLVRQYNQRNDPKIKGLRELAFSGLTLAGYRSIFNASGLRIVSFHTNRMEKALGRILALPGKIPFLEDYFAFNVYAVLERERE